MRFSQTKLLGVGRHGLMVRALSPTLGDKWTDQGVRGSNPAAALSRSFLGWTNNRTYLGGINAIDFSIATTHIERSEALRTLDKSGKMEMTR